MQEQLRHICLAAGLLFSPVAGSVAAKDCPPPPHLQQKVLIINRFPTAGHPGELTDSQKAHVKEQLDKFTAFLSSHSGSALQIATTQLEMRMDLKSSDYEMYGSQAAASYNERVQHFLAGAGVRPEDYDGIIMVYPDIAHHPGTDLFNNTWIYFNDQLAATIKVGPGFSSVIYFDTDDLSEAMIHEYLHQLDHRFEYDAGDAEGFMSPDDKAGRQALAKLMGTTFGTEMDYLAAIATSYVGSDGKLHAVNYSELAGKRGTLINMIERMRWGTWKGTVHETSEGKDFDVAFGGHGKYWTESKGERAAQLEFRSMAVEEQRFYVDARRRDPPRFELGHSTGSYTSTSNRDIRYVDDYREHIPSKIAEDAIGNGSVSFGDDPRWDLDIASHASGPGPRLTTPRFNLSGKDCIDGVIEGKVDTTRGNPASYFYFHRTLSWSFTLQGADVPRHVTLVEKLPRNYDEMTAIGLSNYVRAMEKEISPLYVKLSQERKYDKANALMRVMTDASRNCREAARAIEPSWPAIASSFTKLSGFWISNDPDADAKYDNQLQQFQTEIQQFKDAKTQAETRCRTEVEQATSKAGEDDVAVAAALRALTDKMKNSGAEGFVTP